MKYHRIFIAVAASLSIVIVLSVLGQGLSRRGQAGEEPLPTPMFDFQPEPTATLPVPPTDVAMIASETLFSDGFATEESLQSWTFLDLAEDLLPENQAVWQIENGYLLQDATGPAATSDPHEILAVTGPSSWTDYTITADVYDRYNATFGLVARRQGNSFYRYRVLAEPSTNGSMHVVEKVIDGVVTPLVEVNGPGYTYQRWYSVTLSVVGSTITVMLDGETVATATDTTLTNGQGGLYTLALGGILFDNVQIVAP